MWYSMDTILGNEKHFYQLNKLSKLISFTRPATVECVKTDETEVVNTNYKKMFSRPPTVGYFRVKESPSSEYNIIRNPYIIYN